MTLLRISLKCVYRVQPSIGIDRRPFVVVPIFLTELNAELNTYRLVAYDSLPSDTLYSFSSFYTMLNLGKDFENTQVLICSLPAGLTSSS